MYAVGHFALGYLTGKIASKPLKVNINLPLLFLASVFPDIDILIPGLQHRGPLHSVVLFCILFIPIFLLYKKRAVPYFVALIQHPLIGDYLTGGVQLLWPVSMSMYCIGSGLESLSNIALELVLFVVSVTVMFKTKDMFSLFKPHPLNMILSIPLIAVLLPTVISYPLSVPLVMLIPHLFYFVLFSFSILMNLKSILTKN
jgi:hypothetical protein